MHSISFSFKIQITGSGSLSIASGPATFGGTVHVTGPSAMTVGAPATFTGGVTLGPSSNLIVGGSLTAAGPSTVFSMFLLLVHMY